jgi:hypothetical protein
VQGAWDAFLSYLTSRGYCTQFGRNLYHDLCDIGLDDVEAEGFVGMQVRETPSARFWPVTLEQVQDQVLAAGLLTEAELDDYRILLESPEYRWLNLTMMSAWGRRPVS